MAKKQVNAEYGYVVMKDGELMDETVYSTIKGAMAEIESGAEAPDEVGLEYSIHPIGPPVKTGEVKVKMDWWEEKQGSNND